MDYIYKKWYQENDKKVVEQRYLQRLHGEATVATALTIHPMNQPQHFPLYYVPTNDIMLKIERVQKNDCQLSACGKRLPGVAKKDFLLDIIAEELQSSNSIEGVKSQKAEIAKSARRIHSGKQLTKMRMHSMIQSYLKLMDHALKLPEDAKDIRKIYNFITEGEIAQEDLPDGALFIKERAEVQGNSYGTVIHQGVRGEVAIQQHIEDLLSLLQGETVPYLIKLAIGHYYFGYIHPFYDGNGRTNRFMTSLYLSKHFSTYTTYAFANGCRIQQKKYLELFDRTNKFNNYGEMNFAIDAFLEILIAGQTFILERLQEKEALLDKAHKTLQQDPWLREQSLARNLVFVLCQAHFFSEGSMERNELEQMIQAQYSISRRELYTTLESLEAQGYIIKVSRKPMTYVLNQAILEQ